MSGSKKHFKEMKKSRAHAKKSGAVGGGKGCVIKCVGSSWNKTEVRHGAYRYNGYQEALGKDSDSPAGGKFTDMKTKKSMAKKDLYNINFRSPRVVAELGTQPLKNKDWYIGEGKNYYRQAHTPCLQNSHHILPFTSLNKVLKARELKLLMAAEYNLNAGVNIIILPKELSWANALQLPDHPHGHTQYNDNCITVVTELKQDIMEGRAEDCMTADDAKGLKDDLEMWEENEFAVLVQHGRDMAAKNGEKNRVDGAPMATKRKKRR